MFLAITGAIEFWDTDDQVLLLGPWCLRYDRKSEWERLRYTMAPNPWEDQRAVHAAAQHCGKVIDSLIADLAVYLNRVHGVRHGERYWRILLEPWLLYYVHPLYDRYVCLKRAIESCRGLRTVVLSPSRYETPIDTMNFLTRLYWEDADWSNLQLYSQILNEIDRRDVVLKEVALSPHERGSSGRQYYCDEDELSWPESVVKRTTRWACRALVNVATPKVMLGGGVGLRRNELRRLMWAMAFRGLALPAPQVRRRELNRDDVMREGLGDIPASDEFTTVLVRTLKVNLPLVYLEGYSEFREACLKEWPNPPAVLLSSDGWTLHESFKLLAAEFAERGARLVAIQHGAGYGTSEAIPQEDHECTITDRWFSFGWNDPRRGDKVRPLPQPMFLPVENGAGPRDQTPKEILLVAWSHPRYPHRFESHPVGKFDEVLEWLSQFINALPTELRSRLVVRLPGTDRGLCQAQRLTERCGPLCFDDRKQPFRDTLGKYGLVVVDYPSTTCLELLAANVPAVFFWDPKGWPMREEARPYFDALWEAGVLWISPREAATKVSEVYEHSWDWWRQPQVQEARRNFTDRYALGRHDWLNCWVKTLQEEIALSCVGVGK